MTATTRSSLVCMSAAFIVTTLFAVLPARGAPPTPAEIRAKFDAGDYSAALRGIAQALALKGGAAEGYDRYELFMLKGECLVQVGSGALAADAFEDAREATDDPAKIGAARGNEVILRRAPGLKYVPKTGPDKAPIDLKPVDGRKRGMLALRADILAVAQPKIAAAKKADDLVPAMALLTPLREATVLEIGATGDFAGTRPTLQAIGTHARELITRELKRCRSEVEAINAAAGEIVGFNGDIGRRGLFTPDRRDLASIADYVGQIQAAGREGRRIASLLNGSTDAWERIVADSSGLAERIEMILRRVD